MLRQLFGPPRLARSPGDIDEQARPFADLIEQSGDPARLTLRLAEACQMLVIGDKLSGLAFSIPVNAPEKSVLATPTMLRCSYSGGVAETWMIVARKSELGAMTEERALAAHVLVLQRHKPTIQVLRRPEAPARLDALDKTFPLSRRVVRAWLRDDADDFVAAIALADVRGYRIFQTVEGSAAAVVALAPLSFATALHPERR